MLTYECDKCGACCKGIPIVETDDLDVLREPRLIDADPHHRGKSVAQMVLEIRTEMKAVIIACGSACPFLGTDNGCTIYPTRPNACVGMEVGDEQCQDARARQGLPPLPPVV
jgi:Fe-S-cluster containining protein